MGGRSAASAGGQSTVAGPRAGDPLAVLAPGSPPAEVTRLVGRDRESAEVRQLVGRTRLLTLAGAGGSGKTRLALRVARELAATFRHRVCWVELAALEDPALVAQRIASALGVPESPGRPILPSI